MSDAFGFLDVGMVMIASFSGHNIETNEQSEYPKVVGISQDVLKMR